jgi:tetratricopeptide (TPR) repeat protein
MRFLSLFIILLSAFSAFASCGDQYSIDPSVDLKCKYINWENHPTKSNLVPLLRSLFYVYASNGEDLTMKKFFDGMRKGDVPFNYAIAFRDELLRKYTFEDSDVVEASGVWAMQAYDARMLFILTQTDPYTVSREITAAMYLSVFDEFKRFFCLQLDNDSIGILPPKEYSRLLEILRRMDWLHDPFLKSTNLLYQGIVNINLQSQVEARTPLNRARELLDRCFETADGKLSKKRILRSRAAVNFALENMLEAQSDYYRILKIDPNDGTALLELSYVLNERGECQERGVWIEASIKSNQTEYEVVIHCGNQLYEFEEYPTDPSAVVASLFALGLRREF